MAVNRQQKLMIVGCGPGSPEYMTEVGRRAIDSAQVLVGAPHLLELYTSSTHKTITFASDIKAVLDDIAAHLESGVRIAVLVSGDPGLCSLAGPVLKRFGRAACKIIPGISSVQMAFARLGLDWMDGRILSAHKSIPDIDPDELSSAGTLAILAGHRQSQAWIADIADVLDGGWVAFVCQNLSLPNEKISRVTIEQFCDMTLSTRTIVLLVKEELL